MLGCWIVGCWVLEMLLDAGLLEARVDGFHLLSAGHQGEGGVDYQFRYGYFVKRGLVVQRPSTITCSLTK